MRKSISPTSSFVRKTSLHHVWEVSRDVTVAAHRNVSIAVWRNTPTVAALQRIDGYVTELTASYTRVAAVVVIDAANFRPPDQDAREEHARMTRKYEAIGLGTALVMDSSGMKSSLFRFVLTTIQLISSPKVPQNIFDTVDSATSWLSAMTPGVRGHDLSVAIGDARKLQPLVAVG